MTVKELRLWAADPHATGRVIYAHMTKEKSPPKHIMTEAWNLYAMGIVSLVQRREPDGSLAYLAELRRVKSR